MVMERKRITQKRIFFFVIAFLVLGMVSALKADAAGKTTLSSKKLNMYAGSSKTLKVKNNRKKVSWKIIAGKQFISLKNQKNTSVRVVAKEVGTAKVQAEIGKKKLVCLVKIKNAKKNAKDVKALKVLIKKTGKGTKVSRNINNRHQYNWNDKGKLVGINWTNCKLKGKISFTKFANLKYIYCDINQLTEITTNKKCKTLFCAKNRIVKMNLKNSSNLETLFCAINRLASLDVSKNGKLKELYCGRNKLTKLDISKNRKLVRLSCYNNLLKKLNLTTNKSLKELYFNNAKLKKLDLSKNTKLEKLESVSNDDPNDEDDDDDSKPDWKVSECPITSLDTSKNVKLDSVGIYRMSQLKTLDFSKNIVLKSLNCGTNSKLKSINLKGIKTVSMKNCIDNKQLNSIVLGNNTALYHFECQNNALTSLDVSEAQNLENLSCYGNQLTSMDITGNPLLRCLDCQKNQLSELNVAKNPLLVSLSCSGNQIAELDISNNPLLTSLDTDKDTIIRK